jgi:hypothetical protein
MLDYAGAVICIITAILTYAHLIQVVPTPVYKPVKVSIIFFEGEVSVYVKVSH